jgi:hypothetical protein
MGRFLWVEYFDDWQNAIDILNDLAWNLSWKEHNGRWHLWGGDQKIFVSDTEGEFQAFLCGMALSFAVLPDSILEQIRQIANE